MVRASMAFIVVYLGVFTVVLCLTCRPFVSFYFLFRVFVWREGRRKTRQRERRCGITTGRSKDEFGRRRSSQAMENEKMERLGQKREEEEEAYDNGYQSHKLTYILTTVCRVPFGHKSTNTCYHTKTLLA